MLTFYFYLLNISALLVVYRIDIGGMNITAIRICTLLLAITTLFQIPNWSYRHWRGAAVAGILVILRLSDLLRGYDSVVLQAAVAHAMLLLLFVCLYGLLRSPKRIVMF